MSTFVKCRLKMQSKTVFGIGCVLLWQIIVLIGLGRLYYQSDQTGGREVLDGTPTSATVRNNGATGLPPSVPSKEIEGTVKTTTTFATSTTATSVSSSTMTSTSSSPPLKIPTPTTITLSASTVKEMCFPYNTDLWLNDSIHRPSNNDFSFTPELVDILLEGPIQLDKLSKLFEQTLCHPDSVLRNASPHEQDAAATTTTMTMDDQNHTDLGTIEGWYHRFFYLALHWRFHQPAMKEYQRRKRCLQIDTEQGTTHLRSFMDQHSIGLMDYECSNTTKYIVLPVGSVGLGAFLNTQASLSILLALQSGRIPIFTVQSLFPWQTRKGKTDPWLLAPSQCERKDLQCYFLPPSPCTVTSDDITSAPLWGATGKEQRWFNKGNVMLPPELEDHRVVVINSGLSVKGSVTDQLRTTVSTVIQDLISEWKNHHKNQQQQKGAAGTGARTASSSSSLSWSDRDWHAMDIAQKWLTEKGVVDPDGLLRHVHTYLLRPNPHYKDILERRLSTILPKDLDPSQTVGFAIRGSDKCLSESTCLPFQRYMEIATDVAYPSLVPRKENVNNDKGQQQHQYRPKVIMTTEDPDLFNQSLAYQHNTTFPFEFVVNDQDNMQGSGYPKDFLGDGENTIISSLLALQMHLSAGRVYLNCCSNFHGLLSQLIGGQCGAIRHGHSFVYDNITNGTPSSTVSSSTIEGTATWGTSVVPTVPKVAYCLNDDWTPSKYRICCGWSGSDSVCKEIWVDHKVTMSLSVGLSGNPKK
jgi:hypothetical protein